MDLESQSQEGICWWVAAAGWLKLVNTCRWAASTYVLPAWTHCPAVEQTFARLVKQAIGHVVAAAMPIAVGAGQHDSQPSQQQWRV